MASVITVKYFDSWSVDWFSYQVNYIMSAGQPVIPIIIDSYGGEVYSAFAMIDILKATGKPISTMIRGKAMSAGALLFTAGSKGMRFIGENAALMIHDSACCSWGKMAENSANAKEGERVTSLMLSHFDKAANKSSGFFNQEIINRRGADWYLSPQEAVSLGLADDIKTPLIFNNLCLDDLLLCQELTGEESSEVQDCSGQGESLTP